MNEQNTLLNKLIEDVLKSSKYRNICIEFIKNIGIRELSKRRNIKEAIKATKNKLHQVAGAYWSEKIDYDGFLSRFKEISELEKDEHIRKICYEVMKCHSSTRERLAILEEFYSHIFSALPPIRSVIDIGCGLNPLSIPWMRLHGDVRYYAYDIYKDMVEFLDNFMTIIDINGRAETRDIIASPPDTSADLAFVLKSIPCLEQVDKNAGRKILEMINTNYLIVSFPIQSLGGKNKNMIEHYANRFDELTADRNWQVQRFDFNTELVFLVKK